MESVYRSRLAARLVLAGVMWCHIRSAGAELLPFPLSAGQRGTVSCLESSVSYDIYLPSAYASTGAPLPIIYTFSPFGGGMVGAFQAAAEDQQFIAVGVTGSKNSNRPGYDPKTFDLEVYAVTRDIRTRVLFDPSAEFAGGFSGGGWVSYDFSRTRSQHVSGVLAMAGLLGATSHPIPTTKRVPADLLIARITGLSDTVALHYLDFDRSFLLAHGAILNDTFFAGGHHAAPAPDIADAMRWLIQNRVPAGTTDQADAQSMAADWRNRIPLGQRETVFRECAQTLMTQPRSWSAFQAQLLLDDLTSDPDTFCTLEVHDLAQGDYASDMLLFAAEGAAYAGDGPRYHSYLRALTGVTGTSGDRNDLLQALLSEYTHRPPEPQLRVGPTAGELTLWTRKYAPGLTYTVKRLVPAPGHSWEPSFPPQEDSPTTWSSTIHASSNHQGVAQYRLISDPP